MSEDALKLRRPLIRVVPTIVRVTVASLALVIIVGLVTWQVVGHLPINWTWVGWNPLVAIGTLALALTTVVLAGITAWNVQQTRDLVAETEDLVKATEKSAKAAEQTIAEIQRDRELEYRPYLSWKLITVTTQGTQIVDPGQALVVNFGRGPAIYCLCCATWMAGGPGATPDTATSYLGRTDLFDLSPNDPGTVSLQRRSGWVPDDSIAGIPVAANPPNRLAFCQDHLGTYYRFVPYEPTVAWHVGDSNPPRWVEFYLSHFNELKKA